MFNLTHMLTGLALRDASEIYLLLNEMELILYRDAKKASR